MNNMYGWILGMAIMGFVALMPNTAEAHCDTLDGPVVTAAQQALDSKDINRVLPFIPKNGEPELKEAFAKVLAARTGGKSAQEVADRYFFETTVRIHRAGEGAAFTGLQPAGMDFGPALPTSEKAIQTGSLTELNEIMAHELAEVLELRLHKIQELKAKTPAGDVDALRKLTSEELQFQIFVHELYEKIREGGAENAHQSEKEPRREHSH
ncbi:MAG: hypothetical protein K0Q77_2413 [Anaerosporomusa subterranea]|nr:hypothetical protein [Anaerosporomusa subterranea]